MSVAVVIPAFNAGPLVVEAVESVLAQTRPADDVIIVDDGSTDDTADRLSGFGPPVRVIRQPNGGVSSARNRGVAAASSDVVAFLDADDVWHPRKLELQLPALAQSDLVALGTGHYGWPAPSHPPVDSAGEPVPIPFAQLVVRNCLIASTVVVRVTALRAAGEFDTRQQGTEDHDLWLRLARIGPVANLSARLVGYRTATVGSLSKNAVRMEDGMRLILRKLETSGAFHARPLLRHQAWGYFHYTAGHMHHRAGHRGSAVRHLARSLLEWPFPYSRADVRYRFGRLRLLVAALHGRDPADLSQPQPAMEQVIA